MYSSICRQPHFVVLASLIHLFVLTIMISSVSQTLKVSTNSYSNSHWQNDSIINSQKIEQQQKKMSVTISNCNQICNAPTNHSSAKMLYSFRKQPRFLKRRPVNCDQFYDLKNTISTRGAGFGYGNKYDFTKELPQSPPPNSYQIPGDCSQEVISKKGFAFGQSREKMVITGPLVDTINNKNPGPGNYQPKPIRTKISYSLSCKLNTENREKLGIPGPGKYPITFSISKEGKYFQSKHKSSCTGNFGKVLGRCQTAENKVPGPGVYDVATFQDISPKGRYCLSRSKNCFSRAFGHSVRGEVALNRSTPGPGNYVLPSEFGHYISKKCLQKENKENNLAETANDSAK